MKATKSQIKDYMEENLDDNWDLMTGDFNMTQLAEGAAEFFGDNIANEEIPEIYYDIACDVVNNEELDTFLRR